MKCSRCKKWIEGKEIKFAVEGDWMGKPLCRRCKSDVEEESRAKYRNGLARQKSMRNQYYLDIYGSR